MKSQWRDIPGYRGIYQASTSGKIRSLKYRGCQGQIGTFTPAVNKKGYLQIVLRKNGIARTLRVHRLVAAAFLGPSFLTVNHKNGDKTDNRPCNLEYLSNRDNMRHAYCTGIRVNPKGQAHSQARLTESTVRAILNAPTVRGSGRRLAQQYGVSYSLISAIRTRRLWRHL